MHKFRVRKILGLKSGIYISILCQTSGAWIRNIDDKRSIKIEESNKLKLLTPSIWSSGKNQMLVPKILDMNLVSDLETR